jgi:hypothetical protein
MTRTKPPPSLWQSFCIAHSASELPSFFQSKPFPLPPRAAKCPGAPRDLEINKTNPRPVIMSPIVRRIIKSRKRTHGLALQPSNRSLAPQKKSRLLPKLPILTSIATNPPSFQILKGAQPLETKRALHQKPASTSTRAKPHGLPPSPTGPSRGLQAPVRLHTGPLAALETPTKRT